MQQERDGGVRWSAWLDINMKYLKTWMGVSVSTGVGMGDDGGYPERQFVFIENLDDLVRTYDPKADYYKLMPVDVKPIVTAANDLR